MRHLEILWTPGREGNIAHLREHGVSRQEAEDVLQNPIATDVSRSSGRPIAFGYTRSARKIAVVYEFLDRITVYPITVYDVE